MSNIWTTIWCAEIRTILHVDQRIKNPAKLFGKHLPLTSYSRFTGLLFFYKLPYESLHGTIQFAVSGSIPSHTTNRMLHPDIWKHSCLFTCCSIFAVSTSSIFGILAVCDIVVVCDIAVSTFFGHPFHLVTYFSWESLPGQWNRTVESKMLWSGS